MVLGILEPEAGDGGLYRLYTMPFDDPRILGTQAHGAIPSMCDRSVGSLCRAAGGQLARLQQQRAQQESARPACAVAAPVLPPQGGEAAPLQPIAETPVLYASVHGAVLPPAVANGASPALHAAGHHVSHTPPADTQAALPLKLGALFSLAGRRAVLPGGPGKCVVAPHSTRSIPPAMQARPIALCLHAKAMQDAMRSVVRDCGFRIERGVVCVVRSPSPADDARWTNAQKVESVQLNAMELVGAHVLLVVRDGDRLLNAPTAGFPMLDAGDDVTDLVADMLAHPAQYWPEPEASPASPAVQLAGALLPRLMPKGYASVDAAVEALPDGDALLAGGGALLHAAEEQLRHIIRCAQWHGPVAFHAARRAMQAKLLDGLRAREKALVKQSFAALTTADSLRTLGQRVGEIRHQCKLIQQRLVQPIADAQTGTAGRVRGTTALSRLAGMEAIRSTADVALQSPEALGEYCGEEMHDDTTVLLLPARMAAGGHVEILPAFEREGGGPGEFNLPFGNATLGALVEQSAQQQGAPQDYVEQSAQQQGAPQDYVEQSAQQQGGSGRTTFRPLLLRQPGYDGGQMLAVPLSPTLMRECGDAPFHGADTEACYEGADSVQDGLLRRMLRALCTGPGEGSGDRAVGFRVASLVVRVLRHLLAVSPPPEPPRTEHGVTRRGLVAAPADHMPRVRGALFHLLLSVLGAGKDPFCKLWQYPLRASHRPDYEAFAPAAWGLLADMHELAPACDQRFAAPLRATRILLRHLDRVVQSAVGQHVASPSQGHQQAMGAHEKWCEEVKQPRLAQLCALAAQSVSAACGDEWLSDEDRLRFTDDLITANKGNSTTRSSKWVRISLGAVGSETATHRCVVGKETATYRCDKAQLATLGGRALDARAALELLAHAKLRRELRRLSNDSKAFRERAGPAIAAFASGEAALTLADVRGAAFQQQLADADAACGSPLSWNVWRPPAAQEAASVSRVVSASASASAAVASELTPAQQATRDAIAIGEAHGSPLFQGGRLASSCAAALRLAIGGAEVETLRRILPERASLPILFLMLLRHYKKPTMDREFAVFSELHAGVPTMDALVAPDEAMLPVSSTPQLHLE